MASGAVVGVRAVGLAVGQSPITLWFAPVAGEANAPINRSTPATARNNFVDKLWQPEPFFLLIKVC
jgi:hypothetical protein